jgi:uncharacterized protein with HEPN domain
MEANDKNKLRLQHILDSINKIEIIREGLTYESYLADWKSQDIIIRNLEIVGEAARHLDDSITEKYPDVEWRNARGMRNFLIHAYFQIDHDEIWKTVINDIPILKQQIENILRDIR